MHQNLEPHEYTKYTQLLGSSLDVYEEKRANPGKTASFQMLLVRLKDGGMFDDVLAEYRDKKDFVTICIKRNLKARLESQRLELLAAPVGTYAISMFKLETKYHDTRTKTWPCYMTTHFLIVDDPVVFIEAYQTRNSGPTPGTRPVEQPPSLAVYATNHATGPVNSHGIERSPERSTANGLLLRKRVHSDELVYSAPTSVEPSSFIDLPQVDSRLADSLVQQLHEEREARKAQDSRIDFLETELRRAFARLDADRITIENFLERAENRMKKARKS